MIPNSPDSAKFKSDKPPNAVFEFCLANPRSRPTQTNKGDYKHNTADVEQCRIKALRPLRKKCECNKTDREAQSKKVIQKLKSCRRYPVSHFDYTDLLPWRHSLLLWESFQVIVSKILSTDGCRMSWSIKGKPSMVSSWLIFVCTKRHGRGSCGAPL